MENFEKIKFNEKRDFSELLNATFMFIKQEFKLLMTCLLVYVGPVLLVMGIISVFFMDEYLVSNANDFEDFNFTSIAVKYFFLVLTISISMIMIYGITLGYIKAYIENEGALTREIVWDTSKQYFAKIIGFGFVTSIIVGFATILFIIPGIYFLIALCLVMTIGVLEDETLGNSMSRSMYLIKNNWWITLGGLIIVYLIYSIISSIFSLPNTIMTFLIAFLSTQNSESPSILYKVIQTIFSVISSLGYIFSFIPIIYLAFHYFNLVERKEEPTLLDDIEKIGIELK